MRLDDGDPREREEAEFFAEAGGEVEPTRMHGVVGAEIVGEEGLAPRDAGGVLPAPDPARGRA
jgi:hypothetical protein